MGELSLVVVAQVVGFGVFLWAALYLWARAAQRNALIIVALVGLLGQAAFFASGALADSVRDVGTLASLEHAFWWTNVLPAAAWFHLSSVIARTLAAEQRRPAAFALLDGAAYAAAAVLTLAAMTSDVLLDYAHARTTTSGVLDLAPGPAYPLLIAFVLLAASGAAGNFARSLRVVARTDDPYSRTLARQLTMLLVGAVGFLAGALWLAVRFGWQLDISAIPGYGCLLLGLALISYSVAHFGLLLDGQNVRRDFLYTFTGIMLLNTLYITLLAVVAQMNTLGLLAIVALVTLTHTTLDQARQLLDRLFFTPQEQEARAEARDYATGLGSAPVAAPALLHAVPPYEETASDQALDDQKQFKNLVRRAITALKSQPQLAQSPLLGLALVGQRVAQTGQEDNRLNRTMVLRELLLEHVEGLRPAAGITHGTSDPWRFYDVLYVPYVRGLSRKGALAQARRMSAARRRDGQAQPDEWEQVLAWLADVDEDTFYKWQRRASDTIAEMLWEENRKAANGDG